MIRFIDLRWQGTGKRFAWWDTITDTFQEFNDSEAWSTWEEFEESARNDEMNRNMTIPHFNSITLRYKSLCPVWAFNKPTAAEEGFKEDEDGFYLGETDDD